MTLTRVVGAVVVLLAGAASAHAQEIEPRAYSNIPQGVNFAVVGYAHAAGGLATDPTLPLDDAEITTEALLLGYARAIEVRGQSGKVDVVLPYAWIDGSAVYAGEFVERQVAGFGDPRFRISVNLRGAPALPLQQFGTYRQDTIVGFSLQVSTPLGQYDETKVVNVGTNRWWIKPELGLSKSIGSWTLELAGAATIFGDNDDFLGGLTRKQDPVYSVQGGVIYGLQRGSWLALHGTYYMGGRTTVGGIERDDLQRNSLVGFTAAFPIGRNNSVKVYAATGLSTRIGTDVDTISVAWQHRWGGGL